MTLRRDGLAMGGLSVGVFVGALIGASLTFFFLSGASRERRAAVRSGLVSEVALLWNDLEASGELREWPVVRVAEPADNGIYITMLGEVVAKGDADVEAFLRQHCRRLRRMPRANRDAFVWIRASGNVRFSELERATQLVSRSGFHYAYLSDIGFARLQREQGSEQR